MNQPSSVRGWAPLLQRLRGMFNLNDPRWGRGDNSTGDDKQARATSATPTSSRFFPR
jgi:modulator of FtsH protease HflK